MHVLKIKWKILEAKKKKKKDEQSMNFQKYKSLRKTWKCAYALIIRKMKILIISSPILYYIYIIISSPIWLWVGKRFGGFGHMGKY